LLAVHLLTGLVLELEMKVLELRRMAG
jgi:hypothetical protein